jgi:hypothetical protein
MTPEKTKLLIEKYPEIFRLTITPLESKLQYPITLFSFECGDGWYNIIDAVCAQIENREHNNNNVDWLSVVATQVKEKYGTLRFYYVGGDDYIDGVVAMAEAMSAVTCETCGAPGKLREGGWLKTLCDEHAKEQGYDLDEEI